MATSAPADGGTLTTMFASDNQLAGNMFDVHTFGNPLIVSRLDLSLEPNHALFNPTWELELYTKPGTWVGFENNPAAWTLISSGSVTSNGKDVATPFEVTPFRLAVNSTTAIYVTTTEFTGMNYTNGTGVGNVIASNPDLEILEGAGNGYPFSFTFMPRIWNGTIHYGVVSEPSPPALLAIGFLGLMGLLKRRRRANRPVSQILN